MMATAFRTVCSILAGMALALVLVIAVELVSAALYPTPPGFTGTTEEMCAYVAGFPQWILALAAVAWAGTAYASTWVTRRIGNRGAGAFVGLLLIAAVAFNVANLPYPMWFKIVNLIAVPVVILLALRLPGARKSPT